MVMTVKGAKVMQPVLCPPAGDVLRGMCSVLSSLYGSQCYSNDKLCDVGYQVLKDPLDP